MPDCRPDDPVDEMQVTVMLDHIYFLLNQDADDIHIADDLRVLDGMLKEDPPLYVAVFDKLSELKICTKAVWRKWLEYPCD